MKQKYWVASKWVSGFRYYLGINKSPFNSKGRPVWYGTVDNAELCKTETEAKALIAQYNLSKEAQAELL